MRFCSGCDGSLEFEDVITGSKGRGAGLAASASSGGQRRYRRQRDDRDVR